MRWQSNTDLPVFEKPDSQEICFIPSKNYSAFVESYIDSREQTNSQEDEFSTVGAGKTLSTTTMPEDLKGSYVRVKSFRTMARCWESIVAFISLLWGSGRDWVLLLASRFM